MFGNLKDSKQQEENAPDPQVVAIMQQRLGIPVGAVLKAQDGCIKEMNAHPKDEEWSLNFKRGFVNLFQICAGADQNEDNQFVTQHEVRIST